MVFSLNLTFRIKYPIIYISMLLIPSSLRFQNLRQLQHKNCNLHVFVDTEFHVRGCLAYFSRDGISSVFLVLDFFIYTVIFFIKHIFKTIWSFVVLDFKYTHSMTEPIFHKSTCMIQSSDSLQSWTMKKSGKNMYFNYFIQGELLTEIYKAYPEKNCKKVLLYQDIL